MIATQPRASATPRVASVQAYARIAGVLLLVSLVAGGFGESYAPSTLLAPGDASATARNLLASDLLFRLGFLAYLVEAVCDVALAWGLYILLRPVQADLALLAVLFRLIATATFAFTELFYFVPSLVLGGDAYLKSFSSDQLNTLALLSLNVSAVGGFLFLLFYGIASMVQGYLMWRSGYLPRVLGALLVLGGLGFVATNVLQVLAPDDGSFLLLLPTLLAMLLLGLWLLVRGVDVEKWTEKGSEVVAASASVLG